MNGVLSITPGHTKCVSVACGVYLYMRGRSSYSYILFTTQNVLWRMDIIVPLEPAEEGITVQLFFSHAIISKYDSTPFDNTLVVFVS